MEKVLNVPKISIIHFRPKMKLRLLLQDRKAKKFSQKRKNRKYFLSLSDLHFKSDFAQIFLKL